MALQLGDTAPDFEAETTAGKIRFHDWLGNSWGVLFSHPKDFTPVCTTELGYVARIKPEFDKRNTKIIGLSVDPVDSHRGEGRRRGKGEAEERTEPRLFPASPAIDSSSWSCFSASRPAAARRARSMRASTGDSPPKGKHQRQNNYNT